MFQEKLFGPICNSASFDIEIGQEAPLVDYECLSRKLWRCCKTNCTAPFICWADNQLIGVKKVICRNGKWYGEKNTQYHETFPSCKY